MKTGANGKIYRSREEWQAILGEFASSGLSRDEFCAQRGIAKASFDKWYRKLTRQDARASEHHLIELGSIAMSRDSGGWDAELELRDGVRLRMKNSLSTSLLQSLLSVCASR